MLDANCITTPSLVTQLSDRYSPKSTATHREQTASTQAEFASTKAGVSGSKCPGKMAPMSLDAQQPQPPALKFVASVALRFDAPLPIGATADGFRFDFRVHGTVVGPQLNGKFPPCAAYLLIDPDGIGTINVRAPLLLNDGALAELEAVGRYDFGEDGYQRAVALDLPNSALGWCPRFLTGDPRYLWLNRVLCVGVGELRPRETRVDYDLFVMTPSRASPRTARQAAPRAAGSHPKKSLYERLGGRARIAEIMSASIDSLHNHEQLKRQNPKLATAGAPTPAVKETVTDYFCALVGGPAVYRGRTMRASHAQYGITEADWQVFIDDTVRILKEYGVSGADREELLRLMERDKGKIVTA
jgi:truncated hemoglobin YjbI